MFIQVLGLHFHWLASDYINWNEVFGTLHGMASILNVGEASFLLAKNAVLRDGPLKRRVQMFIIG